jgi:hypothetical protein
MDTCYIAYFFYGTMTRRHLFSTSSFDEMNELVKSCFTSFDGCMNYVITNPDSEIIRAIGQVSIKVFIVPTHVSQSRSFTLQGIRHFPCIYFSYRGFMNVEVSKHMPGSKSKQHKVLNASIEAVKMAPFWHKLNSVGKELLLAKTIPEIANRGIKTDGIKEKTTSHCIFWTKPDVDAFRTDVARKWLASH